MVRYLTEELGFVPQPLDQVLPRKLMEDRARVEQLRLNFGKELSTGLDERQKSACIQILPGYMEGDGFFIARFKRR